MSNDDVFRSDRSAPDRDERGGKGPGTVLKSGATWRADRVEHPEEVALFLGTVVALGKEVQP